MNEFDTSLSMLLHKTLDSVMPEFRALFARFDLTDQQWRVLRVLWESKKITSADLSARTLLPSPSLVGIIDRLEKKELVNRVRSVKDRRIVYVVASQKGRELETQVSPHVAAINERLERTVAPEEWLQLKELLLKVCDGMNNPETQKTPING